MFKTFAGDFTNVVNWLENGGDQIGDWSPLQLEHLKKFIRRKS